MNSFVAKYLERINFRDAVSADLDTLNNLHKNHLYYIPFENLDVINKKEINISFEHLQNKIINARRGGFCYELNGLFYFLLKEIGFDVNIIAARVFNEEGIPGQQFGHLALTVNLDELWLVDVGFGDSFLTPLKIVHDTIQKDESGKYCIQQYDDKHFVLKRAEENLLFNNKYIFRTKAYKLNDFYEACIYTSTSPKSHFTKKTIITKPTDTGRITISKDKLIITENGIKTERTISDNNEFLAILANEFKLNL